MANANDPTLRSWIDIAPGSGFPIQNLPFGVFETPERGPRLGVAIGEYVLDLYAVAQFGYFEDLELGKKMPKVFRRRSLNQFIALGRPAWRAVRQRPARHAHDTQIGLAAFHQMTREIDVGQPVVHFRDRCPAGGRR